MNMLVKMVTLWRMALLLRIIISQSPRNRLACNETFLWTGKWTELLTASWVFSTFLEQFYFCSTKCHEDEFRREIRVANVNLAPEVIEVFAHSQIFHDHKPLKSKALTPSSSQPATFSIGAEKIDAKEMNEDKLLERLEEGNKFMW